MGTSQRFKAMGAVLSGSRQQMGGAGQKGKSHCPLAAWGWGISMAHPLAVRTPWVMEQVPVSGKAGAKAPLPSGSRWDRKKREISVRIAAACPKGQEAERQVHHTPAGLRAIGRHAFGTAPGSGRLAPRPQQILGIRTLGLLTPRRGLGGMQFGALLGKQRGPEAKHIGKAPAAEGRGGQEDSRLRQAPQNTT